MAEPVEIAVVVVGVVRGTAVVDMQRALDRCSGLFTKVGIAEPAMGYAAAPALLPGAVETLVARVESLERELADWRQFDAALRNVLYPPQQT